MVHRSHNPICHASSFRTRVGSFTRSRQSRSRSPAPGRRSVSQPVTRSATCEVQEGVCVLSCKEGEVFLSGFETAIRELRFEPSKPRHHQFWTVHPRPLGGNTLWCPSLFCARSIQRSPPRVVVSSDLWPELLFTFSGGGGHKTKVWWPQTPSFSVAPVDFLAGII